MLASEALWLILALSLTLGCLGWMVMEYILVKRELERTETERRSLDYQLMRACTRFEAERQELQQALLKSREKRATVAKELTRVMETVSDMRELLAAYSMLDTNAGLGLSALRDDLSQFGHLMEDEPA